MPGRTVVHVEGLSKAYAGRLVLDQVSFDVTEGDIFGLLGPNGAGKSTTIRCLTGLVHPTRGRIVLLERDLLAEGPRCLEGVGAVVEMPAFYHFLTAFQNLDLYASMSGGVSRSEILASIRLVGLAGREHDLVGTYSYGMRQRLGLAQALLPRPRLMILDEPSLGLDPRGIKETRELLLSICREEGVTILLSSHLLSEVEAVCNRLMILDEGRVRFVGAVGELLGRGPRVILLRTDRPAATREIAQALGLVVLGADDKQGLRVEADPARMPELARRLVEKGVLIYELSVETPSLEDLFLEMTVKEGPGKCSSSSAA